MACWRCEKCGATNCDTDVCTRCGYDFSGSCNQSNGLTEGSVKDQPRYNVVSARLDDDEWCKLHDLRGSEPQSEFVRVAVLERMERLERGQA